MHFLNCKRNPQPAKNRIVAESATLLFFLIIFAVLTNSNKTVLNGDAPKTGNSVQSATNFVESSTDFAVSGTVCGNHKNNKNMCILNLNCREVRNYKITLQILTRIRKL